MGADVGVTCWFCGKQAADITVMAGKELRWVCSEHLHPEDLMTP
jgi:hypothetical protein